MVGLATAPKDTGDRRSMSASQLKTRLLSEGLVVDLEGLAATAAKPALRVRSGSCGGLDLVLSDGTWVNAPVHEPFARTSSLELRVGGGLPVLWVDGARSGVVALVPTPAYYATGTTGGTPMQRVGQLCSDRVGFGLTNVCTFWRSRDDRCRFCSIGSNGPQEQTRKSVDDIVQTALAAIDDPVAPARHVLLGGGTPDAWTAGIPEIAEAAAAIKAQRAIPIYAMVTPPRDLALLEVLADAGVDEIGMNVEVFTDQAARRYLPGKHRAIGLATYLAALERAVELFGPINTRSITVVGLESPDATVEGVRQLASRGVMPILTPHRPLVGTQMADHPRQPGRALWELTLRATEAAAAHDVPLGPTCIACQSNTLNVPGDRHYRLY